MCTHSGRARLENLWRPAFSAFLKEIQHLDLFVNRLDRKQSASFLIESFGFLCRWRESSSRLWSEMRSVPRHILLPKQSNLFENFLTAWLLQTKAEVLLLLSSDMLDTPKSHKVLSFVRCSLPVRSSEQVGTRSLFSQDTRVSCLL